MSGHDVRLAADLVFARAVAAEPALTSLVEQVATEIGGKLAGVEHKVKSVESLVDKISRDAVIVGDVDLAARDVRDANRYTIVLDVDEYTDSTVEALGELEEQGHEIVRMKNFWIEGDGAYKGVNVQLRSPEGVSWELQLHTADSYMAKSDTHDLYEESRHRQTTAQRRSELLEMRRAAFVAVSEPAGIDELEWVA